MSKVKKKKKKKGEVFFLKKKKKKREREKRVCSVDSTWADSRDFRKSKHSDRKSEHWINTP